MVAAYLLGLWIGKGIVLLARVGRALALASLWRFRIKFLGELYR